MTIVRTRLIRKGMADLLKSPDVAGLLADRAQAIAAAAGAGHEVVTVSGRGRARASVVTATHPARRAEATSRNLTRALDAGR